MPDTPPSSTCRRTGRISVEGASLPRHDGVPPRPEPIRSGRGVDADYPLFVGMFDEVDEGTALYKGANDIPVGTYFVTYEGLSSDWYLKLTGAATPMIRGEAPWSERIPARLPFPRE